MALKNLTFIACLMMSLPAVVNATIDTLVNRTVELSQRAAKGNVANIQKYAAGQSAVRSKADIQKFFDAMKSYVDKLSRTNMTTAQKLEVLFLKVIANNASIIDPKYLNVAGADTLKNAAKQLAKTIIDENDDARKQDNYVKYTKKYMPAIKAKLAELKSIKAPSTAQQVQILLIDDYVD